jgi:hypothetical protein
MKRICLLISFLFLLSCAPTFKTVCSSVGSQKIKNDFFEATLIPSDVRNDGSFESFILGIKNNSHKDMELIWDKTMFIDGGETKGGFMFEGVVYLQRNNSKPPDIIFANANFIKKIWPNIAVSYYQGWNHSAMVAGEFGIYLTVRIDGREINEKMIIKCDKIEVK